MVWAAPLRLGGKVWRLGQAQGSYQLEMVSTSPKKSREFETFLTVSFKYIVQCSKLHLVIITLLWATFEGEKFS